ncbi:toll/interleukin-1 receptor domain-containing protein [Rhizobium leguminosarum bv. trifolii]|uniref:toll/interleukin-1 receptor domain-containing protein n=1 Tax=Rhizobium ruizarguesonis TaxID=2081791 RepID=UPI0013EE9A85|nr:toll/interleukin-1 receptor domain-containing protein [Rhizobium ruizarguesonis]QIO43083.1 toll/interleukin-1 receptor domain-containing protein [Rhizobium leguminosarum bv. trifolii]
MAAIFLSHAVADTKLAKLLTDLLKEAIGVPHDDIFCSSVDGHGVPMTEDFNKYMKEQIQEPQLVFLLMTPSYLESAFCLMELGAAWAQSHKTLPIVVPPVAFGEVTRTLGLIQALDITKQSSVIDLRKAVKATDINLEKRDDHVWENKKAEWIKASKKIIGKLPGAKKVPAADHQAALETIEEQKGEIEGLEKLVDAKDDLIEKLKAAKNKDAVKAIMKASSGDDDPEEVFDELISGVKSALPSVARLVQIHIIMDHYNKAAKIDWFNERSEFEDAIQRNIINNDEGYSVAWDRKKLSKLQKALVALDHFLDSDEGEAFMDSHAAGSPTESDDRDFWDQYI